MTQVSANVSSASLMTLGFGYSGSNNNGNLLSQMISRPPFNATENYWYDGANRICAAGEVTTATITSCSPSVGSGFSWYQLYSIDNVGNRGTTSNLNSGAADFVPAPGAFNAYNQWTGKAGTSTSYDVAGNLTQVSVPGASETMVFDAKSRMTSFDGSAVSLTYDALGRRVMKTTSTGGTTVYVYDPAGNLAVESGGPVAQTATLYLTTDHLGSTRLVTNGSGTVIGCHDYAPFGEEIPASTGERTSCYGQTDTAFKFTGQERDPETATDLTGLDNFQARMLAGTMGRFLSPDPDNAGADPTNPQSWNMYGYVGNNPLDNTDPTGMYTCATCSTGNPWGISFSWDPAAGAWGLETIASLQEGLIGGPIYNWTSSDSNTQTAPTLIAAAPANPCAGADPAKLDYVTPRFYFSEGQTMSPLNHIITGHILYNPDPKNTQYVSNSPITGPPNLASMIKQVLAYNAETFVAGLPLPQKNGNILYVLHYPPITLNFGFGSMTRKGIGKDKPGNWLTFNRFVVGNNCKSVVTSFPSSIPF